VQKSLMPKGVDHWWYCRLLFGWVWVQKSLMPKGVDHCHPQVTPAAVNGVQKSLMPKGVDHFHVPAKVVPGLVRAKIFDAERR